MTTDPIQSPSPSAGSDPNHSATSFIPRVPETFKDAGLQMGVVESLILKYLASASMASGSGIARELCLPRQPIVEFLGVLKQQQIVHLAPSGKLAGDFNYALTEAGHARAQRYSRESMYVGAAPVPFDAYLASIEAQTITGAHPKEEDLRRAFSDLLISPEMFETLGPAVNSGRGMFLYGFPGNGKSSIASRITRSFGDTIYIPRAIIIDGMIIKLFDEANHEPIEPPSGATYLQNPFDRRWVQIRRPTIIVGGELTLDALEIQYDPISKTCEAPAQMKSNCGTFVIDDFGRQRVKPVELLNRWIVPLEKRFDFLTLPNGKKVQIPFDQLVIFATNLEPRDLCDEAFLRRIPYKVNVVDPTEDQFRKLFGLVGPGLGFEIDRNAEEAIEYLIEAHYRKEDRPFRSCQPRDLLMQVRDRCLYYGRPLTLTRELLDQAVSAYFTVV